jgi:hypothetical protein
MPLQDLQPQRQLSAYCQPSRYHVEKLINKASDLRNALRYETVEGLCLDPGS